MVAVDKREFALFFLGTYFPKAKALDSIIPKAKALDSIIPKAKALDSIITY
jgi:hypothetical protein